MAFSWNNKPSRFDEVTKNTVDEIRTNINTLEGFLNCSSKQTVVHGGNYGSFTPSENSGVFNTFNTNYCETVFNSKLSTVFSSRCGTVCSVDNNSVFNSDRAFIHFPSPF